MNLLKKPRTILRILRGRQSGFALPPVILIVVILIATGGVGYYFYKISQEKKEGVSGPEEQIISTKDKIFFVEKGNIFMVDKFGGKKIQITNYPEPSPGTIPNNPGEPQVIDNEYLGYYKCDVQPGDFNCGVYRVSVISKQPEKLLREERDKSISQLTWHGKDTFAYAASNITEEEPYIENWWIYLYKNGVKTMIKNIKENAGGRGGWKKDSDNLAFSPDGEKILHISTGRGMADFNVYVFDLYGNELAKIKYATQPDWVDNKTIIFRGLSGLWGSEVEDGLYSFDISLKKEKRYRTDEEIYHPKALRDLQKVAYWVNKDNGQVWLLDLTSGENEKLLDNASHPLWISQEEILVASNRERCEEGPPDCLFESRGTSIAIFNIFTKEVFDIKTMREGIYYFIYYFTSLSDQGHFYEIHQSSHDF